MNCINWIFETVNEKVNIRKVLRERGSWTVSLLK
jgi:hypothetical protein